MFQNSLSPLCEKEPPVQYTWLSSEIRCEAAVIGGNMTGCVTAAELARSGIDTVLLSAQPVGNESAGVIPAMLQTGLLTMGALSKKTDMETAVAAFRDFALAADQMEREAAENGIPFARRDVLLCSDDEKDMPMLEEEYRLRRHNGLPAVLLSADTLREQYSFSAKHALLIANGAVAVDPVRMSQHYAAKAVSGGARVFEQTDVLEVCRDKGLYRIKTATGREVFAKYLVLAQPFSIDGINELRVRRRVYASASAPCSDFSGYESKAALFFCDRSLSVFTAEDERIVAFGTESALTSRTPRRTRRFEQFEERCGELLCGTRPVFPDRRASQLYQATRDGLPMIGAVSEAIEDSNMLAAIPSSPDEMTAALLAAPIISALCAGTHPYNPYAPERS